MLVVHKASAGALAQSMAAATAPMTWAAECAYANSLTNMGCGMAVLHSSGCAALRGLIVPVADNSWCRLFFVTAQTKEAARESAATVKSQTGQNPLEALKNKIDEASITGNSPQKQLDQVPRLHTLLCCHLLLSLVL